MQNKSQFIFVFERECLLEKRKDKYFFRIFKIFRQKTPSAGECQGAKKNEEKDTKKTEAAIDDFRFLFYSIKKSKDLFA